PSVASRLQRSDTNGLCDDHTQAAQIKCPQSIPKDVRAEYRERFGGGWEERFHADVGTPLGEAKRALNEWLAQIESRIKAIRDAPIAVGDSLRGTLVECATR